MPENFQRFFQRANGSLWYGFRRNGMSAAVPLCCQLDAPETHIFSERRKIKTGSTGNCFVKRYNLPGFFTRLRRLFKTPRPLVVLNGAEFLKKLGIPTPEVQAAIAEFSWSGRREYLITGLLLPEEALLNVLIMQSDPREVWQLLMKKFIPMLVKLHDAGAAHGDLSMRNLYRTADGEAGLIDLDGISIGRRISIKIRSREIARLVSSYLIVSSLPQERSTALAEAVQTYYDVSGVKLCEKTVLAFMEKFMDRRKKR